jgi:hypothetical protein
MTLADLIEDLVDTKIKLFVNGNGDGNVQTVRREQLEKEIRRLKAEIDQREEELKSK